MKSAKILLTQVLILAAIFSIRAQDQPFSSTYEVQKVPANPDVAQLGRFGDIPVNKYNGTANISIPIYEIDHDGLKIPIVLKYNTGGVRVEQEASWVGLGWSLSEGITITREVNGYEDIYNFDHLNAESVGWIYARDYLFPNAEDGYASAGELSEMDLIELQQSYSSGTNPIDTQPDLFTVTLPSGSCKFTLPKIVDENNPTLTAILADSKNFKILYNWENYTFTVTDPAGFVYDFSVVEMSTGYGSYEQSSHFSSRLTGVVAAIVFPTFHARHMISSWRVATIISPSGRELDFTYEDGFYFSFPHFTESHDLLNQNQAAFRQPVNQVVHTSPMPTTFANMTAFNVKNLSLITGSFGSVDFVLSDRSDLVSKADKIALSGFPPSTAWNTYLLFGETLIAKKVDQVVVRNSAGDIVKTAELTYSYFNSHKVGQEPQYNVDAGQDPFDSDVAYTRLKLDRVDIGDQRYMFEYHLPDALPAKHSRAVDFWGFYNGKNNATKVPSFNRFYANHPGFTLNDEWHEFFVKVSGGDRSADINYSKIGNLVKITWPTGGYTELDYEGHEVTLSNVTYHPIEYLSDGSGRLRFTSLTSSEDYNYTYQYLKLAKTPAYSLYDYNTCGITTSSYQPNSDFSITQTSFCNLQNYNVKVIASFSCAVGCSAGSPSGRAVWVRNVNTGQEYDVLYYDGQASIELPLNLPAGTYQLKTQHWTQQTPLSVYTAMAYVIHYSEATPPAITDEAFEVGGCRIKSITNYDANGAFLSKANYIYDQYVSTTEGQVSNGKLMDELVFHSKAHNLFDYTAMDYVVNQQGAGAVLSSDNKIRTNPSAAGSHIGYSLVREERVDHAGNKIGEILTEFTNKPNEYILKPSEMLPRITLGVIGYDDFHTAIEDLFYLGIQWYLVSYGGVYVLGAPPITFEHANGSVEREKVFGQDGSLVRETVNQYATYDVFVPSGGAVGVLGAEFPVPYFLINSIIHFQPYLKIKWTDLNVNKMNALVSSSTTEYSNGNSLTTTTTNHYDNTDHYLLTRTSTTGSDGHLYTTRYYYPKDLPSTPFMNDMVDENRLTSPIIVERYKGTAQDPYAGLLEKVQTFYGNTNSSTGDILPEEVITYRNGDVSGQKRVIYEKYSNYGTLMQYRRNDEDIPVALIWGHYKLLPIAQVSNAEVNRVAFTSFDEPSISEGGWDLATGGGTAAASKTGARCLNTGSSIQKTSLPNGDYVVEFWAKPASGSSGTVTINGAPVSINDNNWKFYSTTKTGTSVSLSSSNAYIDELRLYPVGAQMTSYTYEPLIGMSSQTDPNGKVTYFEYDSLGRLVFVKDSDGNILKSYQYHFFTN